MTKFQIDKMESWQTLKFANLQINEMVSWQNGKSAKSQIKKKDRQIGKFTNS